MEKDYKLGKLLGYDVYIDLNDRQWQRESDKEKVYHRAALLFEDFYKMHDLKTKLREILNIK